MLTPVWMYRGAVVLFVIAFIITVVVMAYVIWKTRREMTTAREQSRRIAGRYKAAKARAEEAEELAARLMAAAEVAVATARQAVGNGEQIEAVSQQLAQLFIYIAEPLDAGQPAGHLS